MSTSSGDARLVEQFRLSRRQLLRGVALASVGVAGALAVGCGTPSAPPTSTQAGGGAPTASAWDTLLAAGRAEGKVVVSGPPDPGASTKLPDAFKKFAGIDVEYLA